MASSAEPVKQDVPTGNGRSTRVWRPAHQVERIGGNLPKPHYVPPQAGNPNGAWLTSGTYLDYEIPRNIGVVSGLNLRMMTNNSATSLQGPPTAYWIQQIEFYIGSNLIETLYPHELYNETTGFRNKDGQDATNEVELVNLEDNTTINSTYSSVASGTGYYYLPIPCSLVTARLFVQGIRDVVKIRVYFPPNLWGGLSTMKLSDATLIVEEEGVPKDTVENLNKAYKEGMVANTVVRQRQNVQISRTAGNGNTIDLTGINGASAGLMVYATSVVTAGGATQSNAQSNNQTLLRRFYIDSLELDDNMGNKKEGLELQRGEHLTSYTWYNSIGTDFPQQPVAGLASTSTAYVSGLGSYTHLLPFSSDFRTTVEKGINTGSLQISTKGNDRLVLGPHYATVNNGGSNATWSVFVTNYAYNGLVFSDNKLSTVIKEWNGGGNV
jgi:hypothetical protein